MRHARVRAPRHRGLVLIWGAIPSGGSRLCDMRSAGQTYFENRDAKHADHGG